MCQSTGGDQRKTSGSQFSLTTYHWVWEIEFRSLGQAESTLPAEPSHQPHNEALNILFKVSVLGFHCYDKTQGDVCYYCCYYYWLCGFKIQNLVHTRQNALPLGHTFTPRVLF